MAGNVVVVEGIVKLDGAILNAQQLADAIVKANAQIVISSEKVNRSSQQASGALARFSNAPSRGISVLDAFNATLFQATNGFAGLGAAAPAAASGLRGVLFGVSSLIPGIGTLALGLAGLATVLALTWKESNELDAKLEANNEQLKILAEGTGTAAEKAKELVTQIKILARSELTKLNEELEKGPGRGFMSFIRALTLSFKGIDFPTALKLAEATHSLKEEEELVRKIATLTQRIKDLEEPTAAAKQRKVAAEKEREQALKNIAALEASSVQFAEKLLSIRLQQNQVQLQAVEFDLQRATSAEQIRAIIEKQIGLERQAAQLALDAAVGPIEMLKAFEKLIAVEEKARQARIKGEDQIARASSEQARKVEAQYQSVAAVITDAFMSGFDSIGSAFKQLLDELARQLIQSGIAALIAQIFGGGLIGGIFGFIGKIFGKDDPPPSGAPVSGFSGRPAARSQALTLSSSSAMGQTLIFNVNALDRRSVERAVKDEIAPALIKLVSKRQVSIL